MSTSPAWGFLSPILLHCSPFSPPSWSDFSNSLGLEKLSCLEGGRWGTSSSGRCKFLKAWTALTCWTAIHSCQPMNSQDVEVTRNCCWPPVSGEEINLSPSLSDHPQTSGLVTTATPTRVHLWEIEGLSSFTGETHLYRVGKSPVRGQVLGKPGVFICWRCIHETANVGHSPLGKGEGIKCWSSVMLALKRKMLFNLVWSDGKNTQVGIRRSYSTWCFITSKG